ncbi:hypothetical protein [Streptomyces sp. TRM68367]|uniref:hypothetical protein n=1 Tax=Streptomyces sp. TRM68367 TaxID=2758415 RepID=UPI00165B88EC|nr:hypothetical protein [Streptomyces sp. TRM68367]MBC9730356.1 hypothetical protein [Streptomyces sp. TRM68367]
MGVEAGAQAARSRALAVLRIRSRALAVALLPAAAAVILLAGRSTGHLVGAGWDIARWIVTPLALLVLLAAGGIALVVARARPAVSPTVPVAEEAAPDLYRMVRDLADRLDVPAPSAIALTPDCDSWLEDRTHPAHGPPTGSRFRLGRRRTVVPLSSEEHDDIAGAGGHPHRRAAPVAPVLVIGSPFLWWMRVGELRAVLAPVVAGTGPSAHPDIAAARRFVQGLDAAVAVADGRRRCLLFRSVCAGLGWVARLLLRSCRGHAAEMERWVAAAAAERAQAVDHGLRIVAQEQVGLAYAGWDRLLTRVALPAWRMGRWPSRLDAGVVAALTELSRRDRLAEGFASRLGERPACDLLEEPGLVDEAASFLAARLFHGGPAEPGPDWSPVDWSEYPDEVVDRKWRTDAGRLHRVLDALGVRPATASTGHDPNGPTLARVLDHLTDPAHAPGRTAPVATRASGHTAPVPTRAPDQTPAPNRAPDEPGWTVEADAREADAHTEADADDEDLAGTTPRSAALAARLTSELSREEASATRAAGTGPTGPPGSTGPTGPTGSSADAPPPLAPQAGPDTVLWDDRTLPLFPLQPPRSARELLSDHITAMVCCAAMDTAGAAPGLDWLDGPSLLVNGVRAVDLTPKVLSLVEKGDPGPLRAWLTELGIRPEKPVRLV